MLEEESSTAVYLVFDMSQWKIKKSLIKTIKRKGKKQMVMENQKNLQMATKL